MPFDWSGKLLDLVIGGVPGLVTTLPAHWRKQAEVRLQDFNPFASIATNEDLLRALRLAWIEAALDIDKAVLRVAALPEWQACAAEVDRFSGLLRVQLRQLRHEACKRDVHPGNTPIDVRLNEVLIQVPDFIRAAAGARPGEVLNRSFAATLAAIAGWPEREVPELYERTAREGLPLEGSASPRAFGELVFSAFAEIIKSPSRYPEAGAAFQVAMASMARELAQAALEGIGGIDDKIDTLIREIRALPPGNEGLDEHLKRIDAVWVQRWADLTNQFTRVEEKLDDSAELAAVRHESAQAQLQQILAAVQSLGQIGSGPNQVAHDTLLALAQRLRPDELLDFDRAVKELEFAIGVALEVKAQGGRHIDHADRFVDDVVQRVAELTAAGQLEQGAESINGALAELDRREADHRETHRLRRADLLEAAIRQGVLLRDADRVASAVEALAALSDPARPAASDEFRARLERFYNEGRDRGINFSLAVAIALARIRWAHAEAWADKGDALVWLGNALQTLGERESGTTRLEEAVQAYRAALDECTRERVPLAWAMTQNNLGTALGTLGERESGTVRLEEAVQAHRASLEEYTRERMPLDWAMAQNNLGNALGALGARESGTVRLEEAVQAYHAALEERTRERVPLYWAMTQNNLGTALETLGARESGTVRLEEAVQAYRAALEERARECVPLDWAATQNNLGTALEALGARESGTARLEEAAQAYRAALEEYTRERVPLAWAATLNNLGNTLRNLGERESSTAWLEEAAQTYRVALEERTRERVPLDWAMTQSNLGTALRILGGRESGTAQLEAAVQAYRAALEEYTRERVPLAWAATLNNLGNALWNLSERESGTARLEEAVQVYRAALEEHTREHVPLAWATTQYNLGNALWALGARESGTARLDEALRAYRAALEEFTREPWPAQIANVSSAIAALMGLIDERQGGS